MYKSIELVISLENDAFNANFSDVRSEMSGMCERIIDYTETAAMLGTNGERCWPIVDSNGIEVGYIKTVDLKEEPTCSY